MLPSASKFSLDVTEDPVSINLGVGWLLQTVWLEHNTLSYDWNSDLLNNALPHRQTLITGLSFRAPIGQRWCTKLQSAPWLVPWPIVCE